MMLCKCSYHKVNDVQILCWAGVKIFASFSSWRIDTRMRNIDKVLRLKSTSFFYSKISQSKLILGQGNLFDLFDFDLLWSKVLYESRF